MEIKQPAGEPVATDEPVAWLKYWAYQYSMGEGNIGMDEGLEVCSQGDIGVDGKPAFPVYAEPIAARLAAPTQVSAPQASAAQEVRAVPEGWKLVPIVPTMEMQDASEVEIGGCYSCSPTRPNWGECTEIYNAMVAAAPDAPACTSTAPAAMDEKGGAA